MISFARHNNRFRGPVVPGLSQEAGALQTLPGAGRDNRFPCPYADCSTLLTRKTNMSRHLRIHYDGKPYVCSHDGCTQRFSLLRAMTAHRRSHPGYQPYPCPWPDCTRYFAGSSRLKTHLRLHTGERPFPCPREACQQRFRSKDSLKHHLTSHREVRPFCCPCKPCGSSFKRKDNLKLHLRIHRGEKPFACPHPDCDKAFMQSAHLAAHELVHNRAANRRRPYKSGGDSHRRHRARPTSSRQHKPARPFVCTHPDCGRAFAQVSSRKRHQDSVHESRRPHTCPVEGCGKTFKRRDALAPHLWIHKEPEYADQPAQTPTKARRARRKKPAKSQDQSAIPTAGRMPAPSPRTGVPPATDDRESVLWEAISPRLPSSPLSADCLQWLARQTRFPVAADHDRPALDNCASFRQWLLSPADDEHKRPTCRPQPSDE